MSVLTVKQASKILGVHENSMRNFDRRGLIKSYRDHRRYRMFDLNDVLRLKEERERLELKESSFKGSTLLTRRGERLIESN
jgi:DNA-binding transcriptional MerR regulator